MKIEMWKYAPGDNARVVRVGRVRLWFSYQTLVAFQIDTQPLTVRKNKWGSITGKHLNLIDGGNKESRVSRTKFDGLLTYALTCVDVFEDEDDSWY